MFIELSSRCVRLKVSHIWASDVKNRDCPFFNNKENSIAPSDQMSDRNIEILALRRKRAAERY